MTEYFVPSRHLPALRAQPSLMELQVALKLLARALDVEGVEHVWSPVSLEQFNKELSVSPLTESAHQDAQQAQQADADVAFELRHTRTWLTLLIKSGLRWLHVETETEREEVAAVHDRTAELLSICAGKSASGPTIRSYHFKVGSDSTTYVNIRDGTLTADALGSRTWGSAPLLSQRLMQPLCEALHQGCELAPLRILELGAGTGLVGLAIAQAARTLYNHVGGLRNIELALTDYHPDVLANLQHNATSNSWPPEDGGTVRIKRLDWEAVHRELKGAIDKSHVEMSEQQVAREALGHWPELSDEGDKLWDTLVAADCCYEYSHATWLHSVATRFLSQENHQASAGNLAGGLFILNALRSTHAHEAAAVLKTFPLVDGATSEDQSGELSLRTVKVEDLEAHDNFGPPKLRLDVRLEDGLEGNKFVRKACKCSPQGNLTRFRAYEIRWVRAS